MLAHAGVTPVVRYVDGPSATPENVADFAWFDWTDKPPLVVVTEGERVLARWDGRDIGAAWLPQVRKWLSEHGSAGTNPDAGNAGRTG